MREKRLVSSCRLTKIIQKRRVHASGLANRAGEMIPEVEGTRPWGPSRKRVPECVKGPKTTYATIRIAEKQSK